jgi:hypothetical protein
MKELEQKAERLIDTFRRYVDDEIDGEHAFQYSKEQETKNAIQSVNHAIYILKKLKKVMAYKVDALNIEEAINEQIELKKILEGRL